MDYLSEVITKFAPINGFGVEASENIEEIVKNLLENENIICIKQDGKGVILGLVYPLYYNPSVLVAQELGWWVEPEYRNTTIGIKLLKEFEKEAKKRGAKKVIMFYLEAQTPDKIDSMLKRLDYRHVEYNMVKDL
ncbi:hypothetical protein DRO61_10975 [Candidatus Bathyarchaeota archaeon]|nr:MAG: hypothetical protein DRO61_10975 [Candidatus Bathyarchaeota archaeon]